MSTSCGEDRKKPEKTPADVVYDVGRLLEAISGLEEQIEGMRVQVRAACRRLDQVIGREKIFDTGLFPSIRVVRFYRNLSLDQAPLEAELVPVSKCRGLRWPGDAADAADAGP